MRKLVITSLISILMLGSTVSAEVVRPNDFHGVAEEDDLRELYFESPIKHEEKVEQNFFVRGFKPHPDNSDEISEQRETSSQPVFQKYRIKISNYFKIKEHEEQVKELEKLRQELEAGENSLDDLDDNEFEELKNRNLEKVLVDENGNETKPSKFSKVKNFFKLKKDKTSSEKIEETDVQAEESQAEEPAQKSLSGGVNKIVASKNVILDCEKLVYDDTSSELNASGNPIMTFPQQQVTLKADKLVYNTESNIIKAFDNVELTRDGVPIYGDYLQIDMNDESGIVKNMTSGTKTMLINAKEVVASEDTIELADGSVVGEGDYVLRLYSENVGSNFDNDILPDDKKFLLSENGLKVNLKAQEVYVTSKKQHDVITFKDVDFYHEGNHLYRLPSITGHTNKNHEYFVGNYPEMGSMPNVGTYIGPGFAFDVPTGGSMKFIPFFNYSAGAGVGAALKYISGTNLTEAYYGTTKSKIVIRGKQDLDDRLYLQYGVNSYLDDWFLGSTLGKYRADLVYRDAVTIPNTLTKGLDATFTQRASLGYVQASNYKRRHESLPVSNIGTMKFRYMAELRQNLFKYRNYDEQLALNLDWFLRGSASVYGTGDTQFVGITGPMLRSQYKWWLQDLGLFVSGYQDGTPMPQVDAYRYGHTFLYIKEGFKLGKYLALSWRGSVAVSRDTPNNTLFQENGFFLSVGPDDGKIIVGYDFTRERAYLLFSTAINMKGTSVDYKKMVIKNPENFNRRSEKVVPVSFDEPKKKPELTHATVIELEDPNKEQPE